MAPKWDVGTSSVLDIKDAINEGEVEKMVEVKHKTSNQVTILFFAPRYDYRNVRGIDTYG